MNQPNIFEIIGQIKNNQDSDSDSELEPQTPSSSHLDDLNLSQTNSTGIFDLNLDEINEAMTPFAFLIEACKTLESLKSQIKP